MFRQKALVKLKSPEQIDEPIKVIPRQTLLSYLTIIFIIISGLFWGVTGRIPETGRGQGILITPNTVIPVQAQTAGQIFKWYIKEGDFIKKNQVLGILKQPTIEQQLNQNIDKLDEIKERNNVIGTLRSKFSTLQKSSFVRKRNMFTQRIEYLEGYIEKTRSISDALHNKNTALLKIQRGNLIKSREASVLLKKEMEKRLKSYERLRKKQLADEDSVRRIRQNYEDAKLKIRDLELKIKELELKKVQMTETHLNTQNLITSKENTLTNLKLQLRELDNSEAQLNKTDSEFKFQQSNELNDIKRTIERSKKHLKINKEIKSKFSGRILELTVSEGQLVNQGQMLAQINTHEKPDALVALAYFKAKEGKQLKLGMQVRVAPSTVSQKQHGSIVGFIDSISGYPVTDEAAVNYVGNSSVAKKLISGNHQIEVFVRLERSSQTPSGYKWTSKKGPEVQITAGTLADVWVTVEQRYPISFVLPKLRKWTGF